ncbi:hypothetical protein WMY93_021611 [Mugilogobius chulae]|uniref:Uncharacterized protein n=1 Tax=Mugilogobius chulae TaxID=88201 RepID=A0AAW0NFH4_9GOBI
MIGLYTAGSDSKLIDWWRARWISFRAKPRLHKRTSTSRQNDHSPADGRGSVCGPGADVGGPGEFPAGSRGLDRCDPEDEALVAMAMEQSEGRGGELQGTLGVWDTVLQKKHLLLLENVLKRKQRVCICLIECD